MPKLSIIIPIYNAENTLARCLESILNQSFSDYELLLVNDGSTDSSLNICRQYSEDDLRIRILDKANGGVSSARNLGLDHAQSEWVLFVDADDYLLDNSLQSFLEEPNNVDLIVGAAEFSISKLVRGLSISQIVYRVDSELKYWLQDNITHPLLSAPWAKFFRRNIIECYRLRFDEALSFGEDSVFVKEYLLYISSVKVSPELIYYYNDIGDNIYKKYNKSFGSIMYYFQMTKERLRNLEQRYKISFPLVETIGVVYNFAVECLKANGLQEWGYICHFLMDKQVKDVLHKRGSLHIKNLLWLAQHTNGHIFLAYFKLVEWAKKITKDEYTYC